MAYRHRQWGWIGIVGAALANVLVVWLIAGSGAWPAAAIMLAATSVLLLLFGWLTVLVADGEVHARFGVGLIRRTVAFGDVRGYRAVRNPWYYGWGLRLIPGGWLYNISGLSAVEIDLPENRRIRIGTNDPSGLLEALSRALGRSPAPPSAAARAFRARAAGVIIAAVIGAVVLMTVTIVLIAGSRPPSVEVTAGMVSVRAAGYEVAVPAAQLTSVALETTMPRVLRRTNGYAFLGKLRGHFDVEALGNGYVFVDRSVPPYIVMRSTDGFVIVNTGDAAGTRALFEQIRALRGPR
jgi:hypothetical protein